MFINNEKIEYNRMEHPRFHSLADLINKSFLRNSFH